MAIKLFLFMSMILSAHSSYGQNIYSYEDLVALESQSAYREFFNHFKDIRPSARGSDWQNMVKRMGEAYSTELAQSVSIDTPELTAINFLNKISELKNHEIFQLRRKTILSRYFSKCFQNKGLQSCYQDMQNSIELKSDGKEILYELGEILRKSFNLDNIKGNTESIVHIELWPYYEKALKDPMAEFYCTDELQKSVIWNKLIEVTQNTKINSPFIMENYLHSSCWKKEKTFISSRFINGPSFTQDEAYKILVLAGDMTTLERATNALIYVLSTTKTGELLNVSWQEVAKLKKDYALREKVMEKMKGLDPLPGVIFNNFENKRLKLVINYVFENVPEYIDLYSQTCLKYMASEVPFPNGNPTPHCQDLFELAKEENLIPKPLQERYSKLRNFNFNI